MAEKSTKKDNTICVNKNASRNYHLSDRVEAGLMLTGTEVKSIRQGGVHINDAHAVAFHEELYLQQMHVAPYTHGNRYNHDPLRRRKLLLHRQEINKLMGAIIEKGYTLVPTKLYWIKGRVKVELALAKGKHKGDKREDIKRRDTNREIEGALKRSRK